MDRLPSQYARTVRHRHIDIGVSHNCSLTTPRARFDLLLYGTAK